MTPSENPMAHGQYILSEWTKAMADARPSLHESVAYFFQNNASTSNLETIKKCANDIPVAKPFGATTPAQMAAPMLVWALAQPWANRINVYALHRNWGDLLKSDGHFSELENCWAALKTTRDVFTLLAVDERQKMLDLWLNRQKKVLWNDSVMTTDSHAQGLLCLLDMIESAPQTMDRRTDWYERLFDYTANMAVKQQSEYAHRFLERNCPSDDKLVLMRLLHPAVWLLPSVHPTLTTLLPEEEDARVLMLNWSDRDEHFMDKKQAAIHNQALLKIHCPVLAPLFDCLIPPDDWGRAQAMQDFATAYVASRQSSVESMELPVDCNAA